MKIKPYVVFAILGLAVLSAFAWWWQQRGGAAPGERRAGQAQPPQGAAAGPGNARGPVPVEVARSVSRDLVDDTTAVGSLHSRQSVMVRPEVSGRIVKLGFVDGQAVKRGQLLVQLDDALQAAQLRQAQAQLGIARTTLRRNQELVSQNFVTQSVVDQAQSTVSVAEAQVQLDQAQQARMRILAPFDGRAGIRRVDVGDYVQDGADIVALEDASSVYVDFSLPERFASRLEVRQKVVVRIDALPDERFDAVVQALEPQISVDGRAVRARGLIANPDATLRAGMFARVSVRLAERAAAVLVPEQAIVPLGGRQWLVKVLDGPGGPRAERIEVRTGIRRDGEVEILDGLSAGERVVTAGQSRLLSGQGQALRLVELGGAGGTGGLDAEASAPPAAPASGGAALDASGRKTQAQRSGKV